MNRRQLLKGLGSATLGITSLGAAGYFYGTRIETELLDLERITIPLKSLRSGLEGLKIVLLSDFHLYPHTQLQLVEEAVQQANELNADLIVLAGDYVLGYAEAIRDLGPVLARLNSRLGIFCVLGNHDLWRGPELIHRGLARQGFEVLVNRGLQIQFQGEPLYIAGLDDYWSGKPDLNEALNDCPEQVPVILLAHEPDPADQYTLDPRISLQLSGHSHGGQVRIPGLGSPFLPPYGRKYDLGLYRIRTSWLYTNRGIGVTVPIRLNCRPEITELTLVAA